MSLICNCGAAVLALDIVTGYHACSDPLQVTELPRFAAGVAMHGDVRIGRGVSICEPAEINGTGSRVTIGDGCDIAAYVVINVADSSDRCLGISGEIKRAPIILGDRVFVGSHSFIGGGVTIGRCTKVAAGTIISSPCAIPAFSLVSSVMPKSNDDWRRFPPLLQPPFWICAAPGVWVREGYYSYLDQCHKIEGSS